MCKFFSNLPPVFAAHEAAASEARNCAPHQRLLLERSVEIEAAVYAAAAAAAGTVVRSSDKQERAGASLSFGFIEFRNESI